MVEEAGVINAEELVINYVLGNIKTREANMVKNGI